MFVPSSWIRSVFHIYILLKYQFYDVCDRANVRNSDTQETSRTQNTTHLACEPQRKILTMLQYLSCGQDIEAVVRKRKIIGLDI